MKSKRIYAFLICLLVFLLLFSGCKYQQAGYASISGTYIETENGQHVLLDRDGTIVFLQRADADNSGRDLFANLQTGNDIRVTTASVPYEAHDGYCVAHVYDVKRLSKSHTAIDADLLASVNALPFGS